MRLYLRTVGAIGALTAAACTAVSDISGPPEQSRPVVSFPRASLTQGSGALSAPPGLRVCFSAEGNALDVVGGNVGALTGSTGYAPGRFGQAFLFRALGDGIVVPPSASLNVGPGAGLTLAAWMYGSGTMFQQGGGIAGAGPIVEFDDGAHLWHHNQQNDPTGLFTNLAEGHDPYQWHIVQAPNTVPLDSWHHTAVTYSKATGVITLYVDGVAVAASNQGVFSPNTSTTFHIGQRVTPIIGDPSFTFNNMIDEVQVYDRGLSADEVMQLASATGTMCVSSGVAFRVTQPPVGSGESGVPFRTQPVITILDANGNVATGANTPVTVAVASGAGSLMGTTTVNAVNGVATFADLAIAGAGSTTLVFAAGTLPPAQGTTARVGPLYTLQVARQLGLAVQPDGATTGETLASQPVVEIRDAAGLRVAGALNLITVKVQSGDATLSGAKTAIALNGRASFSNLALSGSDSVTLWFSAAGLTGVASDAFAVAGLPPSKLGMFTQPSSRAESGVPLATQPAIEVRDARGNRAASATGSVTAAIYRGDDGALVGTTTAPIVNGLATFSDLQINGAGTYVLRFTSGSLTAVSSNPIAVSQVVRSLVITAAPATLMSGVKVAPPFVVELRDAAGLRVTNANATVRMTIAQGTGTISGTTDKATTSGTVAFDAVTVNATGSVQFGFMLLDRSAPAGISVLSDFVTVQASSTQPTAYDWSGFFRPIDNPPKVNRVEGGSTVPVRFSLGGDRGSDIFESGYPASQPASCSNFRPSGELTPIRVLGSWGDPNDDNNGWEYDHDYQHCRDRSHHNSHRHRKSQQRQDDDRRRNKGGSSDDDMIAALQFDRGQYQLNWKTDQWDGTCRILVVRLNDGSTHTAYFQFK